ncbi:flavodoxin domain-containing protein [Cellulomonas sp. DKR-3]|uniref:Flavodoxin domain-containing protein n=1 Tax=Cellulomonas fulva TaxID=2835530 RepID=A0ABS5U1S6_9CELL|nr:flavodoxin domain-containing protein [Cellulomonas fulva]MBT0995344.1 flavodoxin domain-containing protein [Cellulomonas fulva]
MSAVVVFESMFGCTRAVAEAVAAGLRDGGLEAAALDVAEAAARDDTVLRSELLVIGAPTHMRGLSTPRSRALARARGAQPGDLGVHEWFDALPGLRGRRLAVFDTRGPGRFSGSAGLRIEKLAAKAGADLVAPCQGFAVEQLDDGRALVAPGQLDLARGWGRSLAVSTARSAPGHGRAVQPTP